MLIRDKNEIIMQGPLDKNSGGDSARSTGIMALFDSEIDQKILMKFECGFHTGLLTRHPDHYDYTCFTRDQMIPFLSGLWRRGDRQAIGLARRVFWAHFRRGFFSQNQYTQFDRVDKGFFGRDPLGPQHIGFLIKCAKIKWLYPFLFFAYPFMILDIIYATKVSPRSEQNQIISMCFVYDLVWLWAWLHPNWKWPIRDYWCGWRDMPEIAELMIRGIEEELFSENP